MTGFAGALRIQRQATTVLLACTAAGSWHSAVRTRAAFRHIATVLMAHLKRRASGRASDPSPGRRRDRSGKPLPLHAGAH